jgi:Uma2 family endonuclease
MSLLHAANKLTADEFLALPESDKRMELVEGEIVVTPRPSIDHQELAGHILHLLRCRVGEAGRILPEKEMVVRVDDDHANVRCPDLMYVRESRRDIVSGRAVEQGADLVIEILSERTEETDRLTKRREYEAAGVMEYWVVDPADRAVLVHDFAHGRSQVHPPGSAFDSRLLKDLGFSSRFDVDELFRILR